MLTSKSPYHLIYKKLVAGNFTVAVSLEILLEYEEVLHQKYGSATTKAFMALLLELPTIICVVPFFRWHLIDVDPDDNKYVDCTVASGANLLVTEDRHFDVLKTIPFPPVTTINIDSFLHLLLAENE